MIKYCLSHNQGLVKQLYKMAKNKKVAVKQITFDDLYKMTSVWYRCNDDEITKLELADKVLNNAELAIYLEGDLEELQESITNYEVIVHPQARKEVLS